MIEKIKILYVDDEEQNLVSFKANFRKEYEIYTAIGADEALNVLKDNVIPIIISDQRMPHTSGVEFLEKTEKLYPDCIRLLITGQADIEVVIEAINRGQISKYIQKPWDWEKLSIAIDNCVTLYTSRLEIKLKNQELQKANDELNKFVYSVSHDLRSPLTSILGIVNLAKLTPQLKVAETYFEMIEGRVIKLDHFIKKLIDYYKNSRSEENNEMIDFNKVIKSVFDTLENPKNTVDLKLEIIQEVNFFGDLFRIEIIFENLISNALKFINPNTDFHKISIFIEVSDKDVKVIISDNGIGINKDYIKNIFNLFYRTENAINTEGSGIGLYIVKEAIDKMDGKITVSSSPMEGTSFEFYLPNKIKKNE